MNNRPTAGTPPPNPATTTPASPEAASPPPPPAPPPAPPIAAAPASSDHARFAKLVTHKKNAGLTQHQAEEVALAQIEHDKNLKHPGK